MPLCAGRIRTIQRAALSLGLGNPLGQHAETALDPLEGGSEPARNLLARCTRSPPETLDAPMQIIERRPVAVVRIREDGRHTLQDLAQVCRAQRRRGTIVTGGMGILAARLRIFFD
jgi:hypothetical protein